MLVTHQALLSAAIDCDYSVFCHLGIFDLSTDVWGSSHSCVSCHQIEKLESQVRELKTNFRNLQGDNKEKSDQVRLFS